MQTIPLFLAAAFAFQSDAAPQIHAVDLSGNRHRGQLIELNANELILKTDKNDVRVDVSELLNVRFSDDKRKPIADRTQPRAFLVDGSQFTISKVTSANRKAQLETKDGGSFEVPVAALSHIRLAPTDAKATDAWNELVSRDTKEDMLIVAKTAAESGKTVLDHYDGVIGGIDDRAIRFLLDGEEIPLNRSKVYGLIYARRKSSVRDPVCKIECASGNVYQAQRIALKNEKFEATVFGGAAVQLPIASVRTLDFSAGKLRYLSDMEPTKVEYTPYFDIVFKYSRDTNLDREPLRLGKKTYEKGLCIHSKTMLRYRLAEQYRRFQAVMGIDYLVARKGAGDVHVIISGDGKVLMEDDVRHNDKPNKLDLDVSGVRDLEILVDFGKDLDISDHLDLADAKVIK